MESPTPAAPTLWPLSLDAYQALFQVLNQGFCILQVLFDATTQQAVDVRYLALNAQYAHESGLPADSVGRTARELVPDLDPAVYETYGRVALTGEAAYLEQYVAEVAHWFEGRVVRVGPPAAHQVALLFSDITARKLLEQRQAYRLQFAEVLRAQPAALAIEETVTRLALKHFGVERCYFVTVEHQQALVHRDAMLDGLSSVAGVYPLASFPLYQQVLDGGRPFVVSDVATTNVMEEGLKQICLSLGLVSSIQVPVIKNGVAGGILCLVQSVPRAWTADEIALAAETGERLWEAISRARAEQALTASEAKYRTLFDSIDEGVTTVEILFDERGRAVDARYLETNPAMTRQTGIGADVIGRRLSEFTPNLEPFWLETYGRVLQTGEPERFEYRSGDLDAWFDVYAARVDGAGSHQVVVVYSNITERKHREASLAFLAEVSQDLTRLTDVDAALDLLGNKLAAQLGLSACVLAELQDQAQGGVIRHAWHRADGPDLRGTYRLAEFLAPEVLRRFRAGEAVIIRDVWADPLVDGAYYAARGIGSFVSLPLVRDGEGRFLLVVYRPDAHDWRQDELYILRELTLRIWNRLERARAEQQLRESEEKYRAVFTSMNEGFSLLDLQFDAQGQVADALIRAVNPAQEHIDGVPAQAGQRLRELLPDLDLGWLARYGQVAKTGEPLRVEDYSVSNQRWYEVHASRVGEAGSTLVAVVYTDITTSKRVQERLRATTEAAHLGTWDWDVTTDHVRWNAWHFRLLGLEPRDELLTAADFIRFVHPDDLPEVSRRLQAAIDGPVPYDAEFRVVTAQGEVRWMSGHGQATERDAHGRARRLSGIMLDSTARKQAEQAEHLRQVVQQQQAQVAAVLEGQEEERRRIAESLHNGIGQVLFATKLQLDRLPPRPDEPAQAEAKHLLSEAIRQTRAVSHELTLSLLADFGLRKALETICQQLSAPGLRWYCYLDVEDTSPLPLPLQQAVYRLVQGLAHNVAQHAQAREATLEVSALPAWLVVRVEDNGRGFDPAAVQEGLGLKTLRSRAALLGGTLRLESAPGQGTLIEVRLPLAPAAASE